MLCTWCVNQVCAVFVIHKMWCAVHLVCELGVCCVVDVWMPCVCTIYHLCASMNFACATSAMCQRPGWAVPRKHVCAISSASTCTLWAGLAAYTCRHRRHSPAWGLQLSCAPTRACVLCASFACAPCPQCVHRMCHTYAIAGRAWGAVSGSPRPGRAWIQPHPVLRAGSVSVGEGEA